MEFEQDPATEFLKREREELGDLENEIISSNGKFIHRWKITCHLSILNLLSWTSSFWSLV